MSHNRDDGRRQLEGYRSEYEFRTLLASIRDYFQRGPNLDRKLLMALNDKVQKLLDEVEQTKGLKDAVVKGFEVQTGLIKQLQDELARIVPGQPIDAENLAAITKAADDLDAANEQLKVVVPANTPTGGDVTPASDVKPEPPVEIDPNTGMPKA